MSGLPWYPHYPGDYARDTRQLSLLEHGAYRLLMDHYYSNGSLECGIKRSTDGKTSGQPNAQLLPDHSRFYRLCGAIQKDEMQAVDFVLEAFFTFEDGLYTHEKIEKVIEEQIKKHEKKVAASLAGVEARRNKKKEKIKGRIKRSTDGKTSGQTNGTTNQNQNQNHIFGIDKSIPQGISLELWEKYCEIRNKNKKATNTDYALDLILKELEKLKVGGDDPNEVLKQSIMNGWVGVFPLKGLKNKRPKMDITGKENYDNGTEGFIVE